jgi:hypothetical protein
MALYVGQCMRCGTQHMSFDVYGVSIVHESLRRDDVVDGRYYLRILELAWNENPKSAGYKEIGVIPKSTALPTPPDTPNPAARFYEQGSSAMAHGLYDAAGSMFRKCLESVTRSDQMLERFVPESDRNEFRKLWLRPRIKRLKELHAIPPALGDLVDVNKDEGDIAVHEDILYDKESAEALQRFTETFLEQTFTIPAQIARVRKREV